MPRTTSGAIPATLAVLGIAVCCLAEPPASQPATQGRKELRMLWLGSSSLYYHNAPNLVAQWLTAAGMPARSELAGRSGTGVHVYLRADFKAEFGLSAGQTVLDKIRQGKYDYVVLQAVASFIAGNEGTEFDKALDTYCKVIRESGGQPVFYEMGWGKGEEHEAGIKRIFEAAVRNKVTLVAPCASAWMRVRKEKPDLELHNLPDRTHPGTLGAYLNLCCFHSLFIGKQAENVPTEIKVWLKLTDEEKAQAKEKLASAKFDEYEAALPGWMKSNTVGAKTVKIEPDVAKYLQKTAWESWQVYRDRLKGK